MDDISLLGWPHKDKGWGELAKRHWWVPQVEGERVEEENQMAALLGFTVTRGILRVIIVHIHYDTRLSTGSDRVSALVQSLLRPWTEHT